jgi:hypothetical protein
MITGGSAMVISLKRFVRPATGVLAIIILIIALWTVFNDKASQLVTGIFVHKNIPATITVKMRFEINDYKNSKPIENVRIVIIRDDGEVVDVAVSNEKGLAEKEITVPLDKKYLTPGFGSTEDIRGTVTLIAYREGYLETILYNAGVSIGSSFQRIYMKPIIPGGRNEPEEQVGYSHHLETGVLAEKYSKFAGKKVEY